jgi:hypothetical protein
MATFMLEAMKGVRKEENIETVRAVRRMDAEYWLGAGAGATVAGSFMAG